MSSSFILESARSSLIIAMAPVVAALRTRSEAPGRDNEQHSDGFSHDERSAAEVLARQRQTRDRHRRTTW